MESSDQPPPAAEDSDQTANDQQGAATGPSIQARSYECVFCKRGFSNAQALGGHMNIHRKDKAKLKQLAYTTSSKPIGESLLGFSQSVDIPRLPSSYYPPNTDGKASKQTQPILPMAPNTDYPEMGKSLASGWPRFLHRQEDSLGNRSLNMDHYKEREPSRKDHLEQTDTRFFLPSEVAAEKGHDEQSLGDDGGSDGGSTEVDLELRLGSSPSGGTRKFF